MAIDVNIFVSNKRDVIQKTLAILEIASTSHSSINGFDGVSTKIALVFGVIAASIASKSAVFT